MRVNHLVFADGVVLLFESPQLLRRLVSQYIDGLKAVGLEVNPSKSTTLDIRVHKRKLGRRWVVSGNSIVKMGSEAIPSLSAVGSYQYLGVALGAGRREDLKTLCDNCVTLLLDGLNNINDAPQKPSNGCKSYAIIF